MIIVPSQIIITIFTLTIILFSIIISYKYEASFLTKKIKIKNPALTWKVITEIDSFYMWWDAFRNKQNQAVSNEIKILENKELNHFRIWVKSFNKHPEIWTFYITKSNSGYYLTIKYQLLTNSAIVKLLYLYTKNKKTINQYINNYNKVIYSIQSSKTKPLQHYTVKAK